MDPAAGKRPAAAVGGAIAVDEENGEFRVGPFGGAQREDDDANADLGPGDVAATGWGLRASSSGNWFWHFLRRSRGIQ